MNCPTCQTPLVPGAKFCANCGAPAPQMTQVGSYQEPVPESDNPKDPIVLGDMSIKIEGELVPVVDVELGSQQTVYFEHHILLWKQPNVTLGFMNLKNAGKRFFAGLQIFISTARGPGNISFSREAPGQIVAMRLSPGQSIDVREHQFLLASSNVDYNFYWQTGIANLLFSRTGLFIDRFMAQKARASSLHGYGNVFEKSCSPGKCSTSNRARGFGKTPTSGWTRCRPSSRRAAAASWERSARSSAAPLSHSTGFTDPAASDCNR